MSRAGFLVGLALTLPASTPQAQEVTIPLGTSVRIESTVERKLNGVLVARNVDSITVARPTGLRTTVPTASVLRIRVRDGRSHMAGVARGAKYGAITGTSLAGAVSLLVLADLERESLQYIPLLFAIGAGYGTVVGGLIGGVVGAERWTTVYGRAVRVSYRSHLNGRLSVGLRIK